MLDGNLSPRGLYGSFDSRYRSGDCEVCGKKDVKAGRERGLYLCEEHIQEIKGAKNGICNRGACDNRGAIHFNRSTHKWYCTPCAGKINASCPSDWEPLCSWPNPEDIDDDGLLK
jgi:hypothetical protein